MRIARAIPMLIMICWTSACWATSVTVRYVNGDVLAVATLNIEQGQASSGSGTIQGGGLIGTLPLLLIGPNAAPAPLSAPASNDCAPSVSSCFDVGTFSCGCNFVANDAAFDLAATVPVDSQGLAFQAGGASLNYGFSIYDAGDGTVGDILVGDAAPQPEILNGGTSGGSLAVDIPAPRSPWLFAPALALGCFFSGRRKACRS